MLAYILIELWGRGNEIFSNGEEKSIYQISTIGLNYVMLCKKNYVALQFCFRRGSMIQKPCLIQCIY